MGQAMSTEKIVTDLYTSINSTAMAAVGQPTAPHRP
jgi:hypothetical protein